jgi:hypothetical protein
MLAILNGLACLTRIDIPMGSSWQWHVTVFRSAILICVGGDLFLHERNTASRTQATLAALRAVIRGTRVRYVRSDSFHVVGVGSFCDASDAVNALRAPVRARGGKRALEVYGTQKPGFSSRSALVL